MSEKPHRRFEVTITIGADDWTEVCRELDWLASHVAEHGVKCDSVSGGPSSGHTVHVRHEPGMTHTRYFAELDAYLAGRAGEKDGT